MKSIWVLVQNRNHRSTKANCSLKWWLNCRKETSDNRRKKISLCWKGTGGEKMVVYLCFSYCLFFEGWNGLSRARLEVWHCSHDRKKCNQEAKGWLSRDQRVSLGRPPPGLHFSALPKNCHTISAEAFSKTEGWSVCRLMLMSGYQAYNTPFIVLGKLVDTHFGVLFQLER